MTRSRAVATTGWFGISRRDTNGFEDWLQDLDRHWNLDAYRIVDEADRGVGWAEPHTTPLSYSIDSHRTGTVFENESREMRAACINPIQTYLGTDAVLHEVRHQKNGYHTDLVFADIDYEGLQERTRLVAGRDPLHDPLQRFKVWWQLVEYGPTHREDAIQDGCYSKPSKNRRHIDWLHEHGYIAQTSTGHLTGVTPPSIAELHAVELKRRDWQTALEQATRANTADLESMYDHLPERVRDRYGYADYRWVALDAGAIPTALNHLDKFQDAGVGLLGVAEGGTTHCFLEAEHEPRGRYTRDRAYAESEIWTKLDIDAYLDEHDVSTPPGHTSSQTGLTAFENRGGTA